MYEIISALRQSDIVREIDVLELIDEDSVKLIKIKAILKEKCFLYITELQTKNYQKYSYHCQKNNGDLIIVRLNSKQGLTPIKSDKQLFFWKELVEIASKTTLNRTFSY